MIKFSRPMPNPFKLAVESYEMSDMGKAVIGSTLASIFVNTVSEGFQEQQQNSFDPEADRQKEFNQVLEIVAEAIKQTVYGAEWPYMTNERRQDIFIEGFTRLNRLDLLDLAQSFLDQYFPLDK